jgi:citrate lyase subunit beta/citryl-CoA lyase
VRSFLFVPGDSERKQTKALASAADALIFDLEDSVDVTQLPAARALVRGVLRSRPERARNTNGPAGQGQQLWVRVNPLSSGLLLEDLAAVMPDKGEGGPDGVVLPKISALREVEEISHYLAALEVRGGQELGATRVMVIATETPAGLLALPGYPEKITPTVSRRLAALTWGSEDLGAALGVNARVDDNGLPTPTFQTARTWCLLTAAALSVQAIDGVYVDFRNGEGLARELANARRDGFTGKLAIHPGQVEAINAAFVPTEQELVRAQRIIAAFAAAPGAGVVSLDGQMIDRPHLVQAQRILAAAPGATPRA